MKILKYFTIISLFISAGVQAKVSLDDAPMEWLIATTLEEKSETHIHEIGKDPLVIKIFNTIEYDSENDEMSILKNKKTDLLREELLAFVKSTDKRNKIEADPLFLKWKSEKKSKNKVEIEKTKSVPAGHYYFNHIHSNISQDNQSLKLLKLKPKTMFKILSKFLKRRNATGVTAFTDHDTDKAFDEVNHLSSPTLGLMRGIEWGGGTHMGLIGIKKNWDLLSKGREFRGEESIIKSRSSEGFRIVNHPNRKKPFPWQSWLDVNGVEVWNTILESSPFYQWGLRRSDNRGAKKQWVDALKAGKKYTAVGGSDFHFIIPCLRDRTMTFPANFIPSNDKSMAKANLMKGNSSFLTRPGAPKLSMNARFKNKSTKYGMGDRLIGNGEVEVELFADFSDTKKLLNSVCYNTIVGFSRLLTFWKKRRWEVRFYNKAGDVIGKSKINPRRHGSKKHFKAIISFPVDGQDLVRAELWKINKKTKQVDLLSLTNPIYFN